MSSTRSEPPTPRRLREARLRGDVAIARELTGAAALLAGLAALAVGGVHLARELSAFLEASLRLSLAAERDPWHAAAGALAVLARVALPPCAAAAVVGAAAGALQTRGLFSLAAVRFRPERLDVARGLARLASGRRFVDVALGTAKTAAALTVAAYLLPGVAPALVAAPRLGAAQLLAAAAASLLRIALALGAVLAGFGLFDVVLARHRHLRRLRMTRDEIVRERRDDEGDPRHKAERRRLHRAAAAGGPVRRATCVVVNPTRIAVALGHDRGSDDPPLILAKGAGDAAARLRAEARRAGVPIVRDVALARALYRLSEVGDAIPEELYDAAAAVLVHVHALAQEVT